MLKQTIFLFWLLCLVSICKADAGAGAKGEKENEGKGAGEAKERKLKLPAKFAEFYTTEVDGKIFKVPAYDQKTVLSDARYNFDRKLAHDFAKSVPSFTSALIDNRRGWPAVLWHETTFKLKCLPNYFRNKDLKAIDTSPKLESGFGDGTGKMLNRLIANDESDLTRDEAKKRFTNVMKAVEEIVQESSTGLALNWPAMTVDNETLEEYLKPAMGKLLQASPTIIKTLKEAAIRLRQSGDTPSELSGEDMILVGKSDKEYKKALSSGKIKSEDS